MEFDEIPFETFYESEMDLVWTNEFAGNYRRQGTVKQDYYEAKSVNRAIKKAKKNEPIEEEKEEEIYIPF